MNVSLWLKTFAQDVHIKDKKEWLKLDIVSKWLVAARTQTIVMSIFSAIFSGVLALKLGQGHISFWLLVLVGLFMAHALNNLFNDFVDHILGVDESGQYRAQYTTHPLGSQYVSNIGFSGYWLFPAIVSLAIGLFFLDHYNWPRALLIVIAIGGIFAIFYTWPFKKLALGEIMVFLAWGPLMIGGGFYAQSGYWSDMVVLASLPYGFVVASVLMCEHIDKLPEDIKKNIITMPVYLGEKNARYITIAMLFLAYLTIVGLVIFGFFSFWVLLVMLLAPKLFKFATVLRFERPADKSQLSSKQVRDAWPSYYFYYALDHTKKFAAIYVLGIILDILWSYFF